MILLTLYETCFGSISNIKINPKFFFELNESFVTFSQIDLNLIFSGKKSAQKLHPLDQKKIHQGIP